MKHKKLTNIRTCDGFCSACEENLDRQMRFVMEYQKWMNSLANKMLEICNANGRDLEGLIIEGKELVNKTPVLELIED